MGGKKSECLVIYYSPNSKRGFWLPRPVIADCAFTSQRPSAGRRAPGAICPSEQKPALEAGPPGLSKEMSLSGPSQRGSLIPGRAPVPNSRDPGRRNTASARRVGVGSGTFGALTLGGETHRRGRDLFSTVWAPGPLMAPALSPTL